jgi:hypothetical protein
VSLPSSYRSRRGHIHLLRVLPLVGCRSKTPTTLHPGGDVEDVPAALLLRSPPRSSLPVLTAWMRRRAHGDAVGGRRADAAVHGCDAVGRQRWCSVWGGGRCRGAPAPSAVGAVSVLPCSRHWAAQEQRMAAKEQAQERRRWRRSSSQRDDEELHTPAMPLRLPSTSTSSLGAAAAGRRGGAGAAKGGPTSRGIWRICEPAAF